MPTEVMLTTREVARRLNLGEDAVRRLIRQERLRASDISKTKRVIYRVSEQALDEFLQVAA
jgi:excisionase family DNA binding protein